MKKIRFISFLVCAVLFAGTLGGCSPATTKGPELVVATGTDASTFDPHFTTDSATEVLNKNLYNNLVKFTADMQIVPDLATKWDLAQDGVTWTFELRRGVKFHDGTAFNAQAVKACFERLLDKNTGSPRRSVLEMIKEIQPVDEYKVKIVTAYPCGSFLQQLAHPVAAIISPAAIKKYGKDLARNPVGTGPFKLAEWVSGEKIVMDRNPDYFEGAPQVQRVVFRIVPEDATRAMLIESGQVDVALRLPVTELQRLRTNKDLNLIETPTLMTMYVALNNQRGALRDVRVRQAINYAVDKDVLLKDILGGLGTVADAPISSATWGYAKIGAYPCDRAKAKDLLAGAGYGNGVELELWTPVGRYLMDRQVAENLQAQLAEVGIKVKIRQWEFQSLMAEVKKGQFDMVLLGWSPSTGDADQGLFPVFHSTQWPPGSNRAHYKNPQVDSLLEKAKQEVNPETRKSMYAQAEKLIMDEAAWLFLYYPKQVVVTRANVKGIEVLPAEHIIFGKVQKG
ncbi:MAG TPA: glutathione ABC transporter substrate-binding protein [Firmicutes bacterium]|nr:glutathione ABC transporter substrate-binding protein [Bacillota bacterium]